MRTRRGGVQAATSSSYSATLDSRDGIGVAGNDCTVDATHERATDTSLEGPLTTRVSTAGLHRKESKGQGARVSGEQKHWVECTAHKEHRSCVGPMKPRAGCNRHQGAGRGVAVKRARDRANRLPSSQEVALGLLTFAYSRLMFSTRK